MMLTAAFVFTAGMLILASFKLVGLIFGNGMTLPSILMVAGSPDDFYILYPSLFFQVWFWTDKLGLV